MGPAHRDFKERSVVLAVAHPNPWSSASFYLPSQSLADSRCDLHATSRSSHSRRSPSCRFILCRVALVCLILRRRRRLPIPCSRGFSRLSAQLCPPRGIFWPLAASLSSIVLGSSCITTQDSLESSR